MHSPTREYVTGFVEPLKAKITHLSRCDSLHKPWKNIMHPLSLPLSASSLHYCQVIFTFCICIDHRASSLCIPEVKIPRLSRAVQ